MYHKFQLAHQASELENLPAQKDDLLVMDDGMALFLSPDAVFEL